MALRDRVMLAKLLVAVLLLVSCDGLVLRAGTQQEQEELVAHKTPLRHARGLKVINVIGNTGDPPPEALPLDECIGDCDDDTDCGEGLICFQRDPFQAVPGCEGGKADISASDYCIKDPDFRTPSPTSRPTKSPTPQPTDSPTARPSKAPTSSAPTGRPTARPEPTAPVTSTISPLTELKTERQVTNLGPGNYMFLAICRGNCNEDTQCADGLVCFRRQPNETVPGCYGGETDTTDTDYCTDMANLTQLEMNMTISTEDIMTMSDPSGSTDSPTFFPTVAPTPEPTTGLAMDVPGPAPAQKRISYVGNDGIFYAPYPLRECDGDCDDDRDCAEGLRCFQRTSFQSVPGCKGGSAYSSTADFCYWPGEGTRPSLPEKPEDYFRLKLYWQEGYHWQNETIEREWCMNWNFDGYPGTGLCWYGDDTENCQDNQIYVAKCVENEPRQWFTFVDAGTTEYNGEMVQEMLIMVADDQSRCFERDGREIYLEFCDEANEMQRWFALDGAFDSFRFELAQVRFDTQCMTNAHHPKSGTLVKYSIGPFDLLYHVLADSPLLKNDTLSLYFDAFVNIGEILELHDCEASRTDENPTSFWNKF